MLPDDPWQQAKVDEWLFWEQYSHEPYVAVCRFQMRYLNRSAQQREAWRVERGEAALDYMEQVLAQQLWLANGQFSIADIALYAYTSMAEEGGFSLSQRPLIQAWLVRCAQQIA